MAVSRKDLLLLGLTLFMAGVLLPTCAGFVVGTFYIWPHMSAADGIEPNEAGLQQDVKTFFHITLALVVIGHVVALAGLCLSIGAAISWLLSRGRQNGQLPEKETG